MILILMFLNFRSDARSEIGDPVHAGEEEEEEEEEILGSDDDEQEDPKDYVKGVNFSIGSIIEGLIFLQTRIDYAQFVLFFF